MLCCVVLSLPLFSSASHSFHVYVCYYLVLMWDAGSVCSTTQSVNQMVMSELNKNAKTHTHTHTHNRRISKQTNEHTINVDMNVDMRCENSMLSLSLRYAVQSDFVDDSFKRRTHSTSSGTLTVVTMRPAFNCVFRLLKTNTPICHTTMSLDRNRRPIPMALGRRAMAVTTIAFSVKPMNAKFALSPKTVIVFWVFVYVCV